MTTEKILEIARRYSCYRKDIPVFAFNQEDLIAFAQAIISAWHFAKVSERRINGEEE